MSADAAAAEGRVDIGRDRERHETPHRVEAMHE
jgi:hypothetical protein